MAEQQDQSNVASMFDDLKGLIPSVTTSNPDVDSTEIKALSNQAESYKRDADRCKARIAELEEALALSTAKKDALKKTNIGLSADKAKLNDRLELYSAENDKVVEDLRYWKAKAQDATREVSVIRDAHIHEVRVLSRGITAMQGHVQFKMSDTAEVLDRLSKAIYERDEAVKLNTKLQEQSHSSKSQMAALLSERNKIARQLTTTLQRLDKAERRNQSLMRGSPTVTDQVPVEEDKTFEDELRGFEHRYAALGEGSVGAEQQLRFNHQELTAAKSKIGILESDNLALRKDNADLCDLVKIKESEIIEQRDELFAMGDRLHASSQAESAALEKATLLEVELIRLRAHPEEPLHVHIPQNFSEEATAEIVSEILANAAELNDIVEPTRLILNTGEIAQVAVARDSNGKYHLTAVEHETGESLVLQLTDQEVRECLRNGGDGSFAWHDVIYHAGIARFPKKRLVLPKPLMRDEVVTLSNITLSLTVNSYDRCRYFITGIDDLEHRLVELKMLLNDSEAEIAQADFRGWLVPRLRLTERDDQTLHLTWDRS